MPIVLNGSGTITGVSVGGLPDGIVDTDMIAAGAVTAAKRGAGAILQVKNVYKGNRFVTTSTSYTDITDLSISITPSSSSNVIIFTCHMGAAGTRQSNLDHGPAIRVVRKIGSGSFSDDNKLNGQSDGNRDRISFKGLGWAYNDDHMAGGVGFSGVDDPNTTSAVTYKVQVSAQDSSHPFVLNGTYNDSNGAGVYNARSFTSIIAMEVAV